MIRIFDFTTAIIRLRSGNKERREASWAARRNREGFKLRGVAGVPLPAMAWPRMWQDAAARNAARGAATLAAIRQWRGWQVAGRGGEPDLHDGPPAGAPSSQSVIVPRAPLGTAAELVQRFDDEDREAALSAKARPPEGLSSNKCCAWRIGTLQSPICPVAPRDPRLIRGSPSERRISTARPRSGLQATRCASPRLVATASAGPGASAARCRIRAPVRARERKRLGVGTIHATNPPFSSPIQFAEVTVSGADLAEPATIGSCTRPSRNSSRAIRDPGRARYSCRFWRR
jgi:hypothetical protein